MSVFLDRIDETIRARGLLRDKEAVLVAVSGGVDSMVLLHTLHQLARRHSLKLAVAHLNHGLRGRSSDADERLVVRTAKKLRLRVVIERLDVRQVAKVHKLSTEMAGRKARHDFLARTATRLRIRTIALAHHADDQLELFFLRLFRGTGGEGLSGMKWRRPSPVNPAINLVRPFLNEPKAALIEHAAAEKIAFREDASNASLDIQRNRIRHELLPLLKRHYQPALGRTVARLMEITAAEADFVNRAAARWLDAAETEPFARLPIAVQRRCIQLQLLQKNLTTEFELVERLRLSPDQPFTVLPRVTVLMERGGKLRITETAPAVTPSGRLELDLGGRAGEAIFGRLQFQWRVVSGRVKTLPSRDLGREVFDADRVGRRIVLRYWLPGDRFQPIGMAQPIKLQDLFTNQKIPRVERQQLVVAVTEGGELFWVEKLRMAERFKLSDSTNRRLQWEWKTL